jgi:hypothetical protein
MRVGITIGLTEGLSIFSNGLTQNLLMFYDILDQIEHVDKVSLIDLHQRDWEDYQKFPYLDGYDMEQWDVDIQNRFDVLVVFGITPTPTFIKQFKSVETNKVISYKCGNTAVLQMESLIFERSSKDAINKKDKKTPIVGPIQFDEIWMIPQQEFHNSQIWEIQHKTKTRVVPFIWSDKFIKNQIMLATEKDSSITPFFKDKKDSIDKWNVATLEPNQNVIKNMYPMLWIFEHANRLNPSLFQKFKITNAMEFQRNNYLIRLVHDLSFYKEGKLQLGPRWNIIDLLSKHTDAVVCHQWGNPLNYAYFDIVYLGYPLVHNAHLCADIGYYYADWNVKDAAQLLVDGLQSIKEDDTYLKRNRDILKRYNTDNKQMVIQYGHLLKNLWERNEIDNMSYNWKTNLLE